MRFWSPAWRRAQNVWSRQRVLLGQRDCHDMVGLDSLALGDAHVAAGDFEAAEACFANTAGAENVRTNADGRAQALQRLSSVLLARAWMENGNALPLLQRALEAAESALLEAPGAPLSVICKATALGRLGALEQAVDVLQRLLDVEDDMLSPAEELHARSLIVRFGTISNGPFIEIESQVSEIRRLLSEIAGKATDGHWYETDPWGHLKLEMELLACVSGVQYFSALLHDDSLHQMLRFSMDRLATKAAQQTHAKGHSASSDQSQDAPGQTSKSDRHSELRDFTLSLLLPESSVNQFPAHADVGDANFGTLMIDRLSFIAQRADREDNFEVLWQALSWRCRLRLLRHEWKQAASDASKSLMLNIFAAAELHMPSKSVDNSKIPVAETSALPEIEISDVPALSRVVDVPPSLSSLWSCLRMRMVALDMLGHQDGAQRDALLLLGLSTLPPPPAAPPPKIWKDIGKFDDEWHRSPQQLARLKKRQLFRREGLFSLPKGL